MIDLTDCPAVINIYGGSEKKKRLIYNNRFYMVKFPDRIREIKNPLSYMNNQFSEDIGCKIFKLLEIKAQNTFLATYTNMDGIKKVVVACEDFTQDGNKLIEFNKLSLQQINVGSPRSQANIENVMKVIDDTKEIIDKEDFKKQFWDMFVVDGFIANRDRNLDNWGALEHADGSLAFAPIYDCGSSLSALKSEENMEKCLNNTNVFKRDEFNIYTCYRDNRNKILFSEFMTHPNPELAKAIQRMVPKIKENRSKINAIIDGTPVISEIYKQYLKQSLQLRYTKILQPALKKQINKHLPSGR